MRCLYLAPINQSTGYSHAAIETCLALDQVGIDVICRNIEMTPPKGELPDKIKEFLNKKDLINIDVVIQHNLPSEFVYKDGVKNVGIFDYETDGFPNTNWRHHLLLMDKIIVPCESMKEMIIKERALGPNSTIYVIPHPVDTNKFNKNYLQLDFGLRKNTTKFYTISENNRRKNLSGLILAYLSKFSYQDNVTLIIKTNGDIQEVQTLVNNLKHDIRRFNHPQMYPEIVINNQFLTEEQICSLHQSCNIFISASHGEAACIPCIEALGFGNIAIVPNCTAFKDYKYCLKVEGTNSISFGVENAPQNLYSGDESWFNIDLCALSNIMEYAYKNYNTLNDQNLIEQRKNYVKETFSREVIGNQLKRALEE